MSEPQTESPAGQARRTWTRFVQRAQVGDLEAYESVVKAFEAMAVGYAFTILRDFQLAEDAAQDAFLQAYFDLPRLRNPDSFPAWLRKLVFKHCDRQIRRSKLPISSLGLHDQFASQVAGPSEILEAQLDRECVDREVNLLPENEREAILLFYMAGLSQDEIGNLLGLTTNAIKKRLQSAKSRLKTRMITMPDHCFENLIPARTPSVRAEITSLLREFAAPNPNHDKEKMPWVRIYRELDQAAELSQPVSSRLRAIFNALLLHAQGLYPDDPILMAVPETLGADAAASVRLSAQIVNHATCRGDVLNLKDLLRRVRVYGEEVAKLEDRNLATAPPNAIVIFKALLASAGEFVDSERLTGIAEVAAGERIEDLNSSAVLLIRAFGEKTTNLSL